MSKAFDEELINRVTKTKKKKKLKKKKKKKRIWLLLSKI